MTDSMFKSFLPANQIAQMNAQIDESLAEMMTWLTINFLFSGIAPILIGLYLMKSNNFFICLCYPAQAIPETPELNIINAEVKPSKLKPEDNEKKYAPPGF